jgi:hypothetical protein
VSDIALEAALCAAGALSSTPPGAEAFFRAGGLPPAAALLRSAAPAMNSMAVATLLTLAGHSDAATRGLASDLDAVAALTGLMERRAGTSNVKARPYLAVTLLCRLAAAAVEAAGPAGAQADSPPWTPVSAAIVRAGGVPLAVGVLRGALEGGLGAAAPQTPAQSAFLVYRLCGYCAAADAGALRAARGAGAVPLAARWVIETSDGPGREGTLAASIAFLHDLMAVSTADDAPALASRPALVGALAAALRLAARAAAGGAAAGGGQAQTLAEATLAFLLEHLPDGAASTRVAAASFARAGGARHLVGPLRHRPCLACCLHGGGCSHAGAPPCRRSQRAGSTPQASVCECIGAPDLGPGPSKHARSHAPTRPTPLPHTLFAGLAAALPAAGRKAPPGPLGHRPHLAVCRGAQGAGRRRRGGCSPSTSAVQAVLASGGAREGPAAAAAAGAAATAFTPGLLLCVLLRLAVHLVSEGCGSDDHTRVKAFARSGAAVEATLEALLHGCPDCRGNARLEAARVLWYVCHDVERVRHLRGAFARVVPALVQRLERGAPGSTLEERSCLVRVLAVRWAACRGLGSAA